MIVAFCALGTLLVLIPALIAAGNVLVCGIASAVAAVGIIAIAVAQPPTEIDRFFELLKPVALLAFLVPCIWIVLQILPLFGGTLANSAWPTASAALGRQPLRGAPLRCNPPGAPPRLRPADRLGSSQDTQRSLS